MEAFILVEDRKELIYLIDHLAYHTWPAEHTEQLGVWILRASGGITKRANSVFAWRDFPKEPDWLQRIEAFYQGHGLPVSFHVSDASPSTLDSLLERLGYQKQIPCMVMTANCEEVIRLTKQYSERKVNAAVTPVSFSSADQAWLNNFLRFEQFPEDRTAFYAGLLKRMGPNLGFVQLELNGQTAAVGTAILENGWAGLVNVVVDERHRGQGLGYRLMQALAEWSLLQGASNLYLQVMTNNINAVRLYANIGFTPLFGYHYRCKV
jgi:GNAT superfamily N-acetyltransferase